ncbi:tyrosine-type recombinase/integrase [Clostridium sp. FP1]|uniref:tyrosine-type recombinase/integrase n=1 Tax=Clostridium sp. FP1 TaxID=2724076 RepID=UPI0013E90182|nr:site-specific integrase [Clostridium sp. FP1]MBZ9633143.1 site-specific integrase [Clostridium sp. FP1]
MQYSTLIRKKDKGYQYIITYKENESDIKWKTKSKQGYALNKAGKELARLEMDDSVLELKKRVKNPINPELKNITFDKFSKMYIKHAKLYREANTIITYQTVLNRFSDLNDIEIDKITLMDIQGVIDKLTIEGLNPNTIHDYIRKLNIIFNSAMNEYDLITKLPTRKLKYNVSKIAKNKRALNASEEKLILKEIKNTDFNFVILIALKCGLRIGEIVGLTWDNIDVKNSSIKVTQQWKKLPTGEYNFGTLKSKNSYRNVPIPQKVLHKFKSFKKVENLNGRVFNFKNTASTAIALNRALEKYNITVHELRHTYGSKLIANGMNFEDAAELLGHTAQETMKTYSHVNDDMRKKAVKLINKIF